MGAHGVCPLRARNQRNTANCHGSKPKGFLHVVSSSFREKKKKTNIASPENKKKNKYLFEQSERFVKMLQRG